MHTCQVKLKKCPLHNHFLSPTPRHNSHNSPLGPKKVPGKRRARYANARKRKQLKDAAHKHSQNNAVVRRSADSKYQKKHPEVLRVAVARCRQDHLEVHREAAARYQQDHPEVHTAAGSRYKQHNPGRRVERLALRWKFNAHWHMILT